MKKTSRCAMIAQFFKRHKMKLDRGYVGDRATANNPGMAKYDEAKGDDQRWVNITEIVVPSEHDKEQLLLALKYLHDCYIDTDFMAVNALVHQYQCPERITVKP